MFFHILRKQRKENTKIKKNKQEVSDSKQQKYDQG